MNPATFKQEKIGIVDMWKRSMLTNYTNFSGRATRREYWFVNLLNNVVSFVLQITGGIIAGIASSDATGLIALLPLIGMVVFSLILIIPSIALTIRRLHDINRSGWWVFINLIPIAGWIVFIVFLFTRGDSGENDYGPPADYVA